MITVCPSCQRKFRIYAQQLSAAKGVVQCGFCGEQFDALEQLFDLPAPLTRSASKNNSTPANNLPDEPEFEIPGSSAENPPKEFKVIPATVTTGVIQDSANIDNDFALELLTPETKPVSRIATALWSFGGLLLLLVISAQIALFNRDLLLSRYPQFVPMAKQLCERWQCELVRERDLASIVLINRDVRDHPRYEDALLVNITIENQSDQNQPYPGIQLTLFDNNGAINGYRRLSASDYLDPELSIDAGFTPHAPLHLVLELADTLESTVGFEFGFY